ncbi:MAG: TonB-dependent receptor [Alphaproteobacteria bacterium]|nr:TonB-dependent receptor [Alphaproteobacteria bacterium]
MALPVHAQTIDYGSLQELFDEPVTTSATGQPQRVSEAPVTMEIITADDIRRSGANNIPEALRHVSGLSVWNWTRNEYDVSVRGYNQAFSPRLLVLVNGRQVYVDMFGHTSWASIPVQLSEIRQIEVVKGPNSALFGFNAVGGVINIITYNPYYDDVSNAGVTGGSKEYKQGHLVHTQKLGDRVGVRVSAGAADMDEWENPAGLNLIDNPRNNAVNVDSVVQVTDNSQLRVELSQSRVRQTEYPYDFFAYAMKYSTVSQKATYIVDADKLGMVQANVYRNRTTLGTDGGDLSGILSNEVTVAQLEDMFLIGANHRVRLQGEYRNNVLHGAGDLTPGSEIGYEVYAGSAMWDWQVLEKLGWTNALRVDHLKLGRSGPLIANDVISSNAPFDQDFTEFSYNSGLVWAATDQDTFRLSTARGVHMPSLLDFGEGLDYFGDLFVGNPNLDPAVITNYELGYDRKLDGWLSNLRTAVFYQETEDLKGTLQADVTNLTLQPANIGSSKTYGIEFGVGGNFTPAWNWDVNYKFQQVHDHIWVNNAGSIDVPYAAEDASPDHIINAHIGYAQGPWELDVYGQYVSPYSVLAGNVTGIGYVAVDAGNYVTFSGRVGYKINDKVTVALSGMDVNHERARETAGPEKERQVFLSLSSSF